MWGEYAVRRRTVTTPNPLSTSGLDVPGQYALRRWLLPFLQRQAWLRCVEPVCRAWLFLQASDEEIRIAYKRLALVRPALWLVLLTPSVEAANKLVMQVWHPDRNTQCVRALALDKFRAIQQAYSGMWLHAFGWQCWCNDSEAWTCVPAVLSRPDRRKAYHMEFLECWDMKVSLRGVVC